MNPADSGAGSQKPKAAITNPTQTDNHTNKTNPTENNKNNKKTPNK
jgi:hypothetical protein